MSQVKKRWKQNRREFKHDLKKIMDKNIAMAIIKTYSAYKHREHIHKIWGLLRNHPEAMEDYTTNLIGKTLTGRDELFNTLYFIDKELTQKYNRRVPEKMAMGDAFGIAIKYMKKNK